MLTAYGIVALGFMMAMYALERHRDVASPPADRTFSVWWTPILVVACTHKTQEPFRTA
jgi:hypothetical protein